VTTLPIPTSAADLDPAWLTAALASTGAATGTVISVSVEPVGVGIGLVGALARVTPTYEGGTGPATLIAKFPAPEEGNRFVALVLGMYRNEVSFYRELSPRTAMRHAECYFADHDGETDAFVLLLADLAHRRTVDQLVGCTREEIELAVDRLADFHAGFWNDESLVDNGWLRALCDQPFPDAIGMSFDQAWGPVQEIFGDELTPAVKQFGDRFTELLPSMVARLSEPPFTLSHGDYRADNFFYGDDDDLVVCDWQLVDRSRGGRDLAYVLSQSVTPELRAAVEWPLVERYAARLASHGVTDYDSPAVWEDYRIATAFALAYPVVAGGSLDLANDRGTALARGMLQRSVAAIEAIGALDVV
jgi:hypothetical protein